VKFEDDPAGRALLRRGYALEYAFAALAIYLSVQSTVVLAVGYHARHSALGIIWAGVTAAVLFALAAGKARTGRALDNPVLRTEGRVTTIDGDPRRGRAAVPRAERGAGLVVGRPRRRVRAGLLRRP
jgi:hypothetical protein